MSCLLQSLRILDKLPSSDHLPISVSLDFTISPIIPNTYACHRTKITNWSKAKDQDLAMYYSMTYHTLRDIAIMLALKCHDVNCKSAEHREQIDVTYSQICCALEHASLESIPTCQFRDSRDHIVPGFNEYVKELHTTARCDYIVWRNAGRQRSGQICTDMRRSRLRFKYAFRQCRFNEKKMRADAYAKSFCDKDMSSFWNSIKKSNNAKLPLASMINDCVGEDQIAEMWQKHYEALLNSVTNVSHKESVLFDINQESSDTIRLTSHDICSALKK